MGGNACKNVRRYDKKEYFELYEEIVTLFNNSNVDYNIVQAYRNKESFGDMDILINKGTDNVSRDFVENLIKNVFKSTEIVRNGNVISCTYKDFQIDFIFMKSKWMKFAIKYHSYNDLSNIIGRVAHKQGFKFGFDGVSYVVRDGDYVVDEILLSDNFNEMLELFGFDSKRYELGFDDLTDIFEYVVNSKYFNREIYLLENRNHIARMRDKKRKTYTEFLKYIENMNEGYVFKPKIEYIKQICEKYPDFKVQYEKAILKNERRKLVKAKFNGEIVMSLTSLKDKELGAFMSYIKSSEIELDKFHDYIISSSQIEIDNYILNLYDQYTNKTI